LTLFRTIYASVKTLNNRDYFVDDWSDFAANSESWIGMSNAGPDYS